MSLERMHDDDGKTTVHDKALTGCLADGCLCRGSGFLQLLNQGSVPSNAQLCRSSVDGHQYRMLGMFPCAAMVERTTQAIMEKNALVDCIHHSSLKKNVNFSIGDATSGSMKLSKYQKWNQKHWEQMQCKEK